MKRQFVRPQLLRGEKRSSEVKPSFDALSTRPQEDPETIAMAQASGTTEDFSLREVEAQDTVLQEAVPLPDESLAEQDTVLQKKVIFHRKALRNVPMPVQRVINTIRVRAQDPQPEEAYPTQKPQQAHLIAMGKLPVLTLICALGVLIEAYACTSSRYGAPDGESYFWLGLLVIFVPTMLRIISPLASRFERISLLCIAGISFYTVKVILSPLYFSFYDEFLHWRTVDDIARSGHLFSTNALLPVSPLYPGLEIVTHALSSLSGLSTPMAGIVVIAVARILMIVSLFRLYEQITQSARTAGIATLIYMTNPHFFLFDALFIYETLALALGAFLMFVLARYETLAGGRRWLLLVAWFALGAVVVTHHVTDFFFDGLLIVWAVVYKFPRIVPMLRSNLAVTALLGLILSFAWVFFVAYPVVDYISASVDVAVVGLRDVLVGTGGGRHLFLDYSGHPTPLWERLSMTISLVLIVLSLPFGLLCIWKRYRHNALAVLFGIVSFTYPISQAFRFTSGGAEIPDRYAPYIFITISCVLAIFITQFWPTRTLNRKRVSLLACALSVLFLGGTVLGSGPTWALIPGTYMVGGEGRSIGTEGIQSALWTLSYLGPNNRISTDRTNRLLLSTYGDQRLVTFLQDQVDVTPVFFSPQLDPGQVALLRSAKVRYLVIDLRQSTAIPLIGFYFETSDSNAFQLTAPIQREALTKFDTVPQLQRVFDSGDIVIYDTGGLVNAP